MPYLLSRIFQATFTLLLLSVLIFVLSRVVGNPVDILLPVDAPPEARERLIQSLGLDRPLAEQYVTFVARFLQGDLGQSVRSGESVADLILGRLPASLSLAAVAMLMALATALPLGIIAAVNRGRWADTAAKALALLGQSVPAFWVGIVLVQLLAVNLRILPPGGTGSPAHYILPAFTMSLFVLAGMARLLRTGMLEVLDSDYVRFARSKGVRNGTVIWRHALRNAMLPLLSFGGIYFSILITTAIVIEVVFAWPGLGRLAYNAIVLRDFPLMQGVILTTGVIVITVNLIVDLLYAVADPRIRYSHR
jgi:peptide/nickel transport system permease protein